MAFMARTGWARTTLFMLVLEATWVPCCSSAAGTGGVTSHVTSVVIPSVLWGLQGCAKSVLRWEITRDSPDAAQRFAGDFCCFSLGVDMAPVCWSSDKPQQKSCLLLINKLHYLVQKEISKPALVCCRKLNLGSSFASLNPSLFDLF